MILFDMDMGKWVLFFEPIIKKLQERDIPYIIISRSGQGYSELNEILDLKELPYISLGEFGGATLEGKLVSSLKRQSLILDIMKKYKVSKVISGSVVDSTRVAFGLGIPIYNFYDIPLSDHKENFKRALPQARLTIPLATKMFKPFVVPNEVINRFGLDDEQIVEYNFIDPLIWLRDFQYDEKYVKQSLIGYDMDYSNPTIVIREEEYKASYVERKYPFLYESLLDIKKVTNANIIIIPRYESEYLRTEFPFAVILEEKITIQHLIKFADLFIGGGGTLNTEACFLGTPTISTRSFICHYDKWQIDNDFMVWVKDKEELLENVLSLIGTQVDVTKLENMSVDIGGIVDEILKEHS